MVGGMDSAATAEEIRGLDRNGEVARDLGAELGETVTSPVPAAKKTQLSRKGKAAGTAAKKRGAGKPHGAQDGEVSPPSADADRAERARGENAEKAMVALVRAAIRGDERGAARVAQRLSKSPPPCVVDHAAFQKALHDALLVGHRADVLRCDLGEVPVEQETARSLVTVDAHPDGGGLSVPAGVQVHLDEIVVEREKAKALRLAGVGVTRSVLLSGPPGVGKTLAAKWLAERLRLPLVSLDLSTCVSSYLGTSGRNVKAVLDFAKSGQCVLLLDEFDAIAKRRDDAADIGELKRVVNVILVELDRWPDTSVLVAATNHPQLLDSAVERRFDRVVALPLPGVTERRAMLQYLADGAAAGARAAGGLVQGVNSETMCASTAVLDVVAKMMDGASGSDTDRLWRTALRRAIVREQRLDDSLVEELGAFVGKTGKKRDKMWLMLHNALHMSAQDIEVVTGVSRRTVATGIKRAQGATSGTRGSG